MDPVWRPRAAHLAAHPAQPPPVQPRTSRRDRPLIGPLALLNKASHIAPSGVPPVLAQLCSLTSFLICSISGKSCATALQVLSFLRLLLSQPLSSKCSFRFLMCNCTLTFTCVPLHYRFVYIFLWANAFFSLCQCAFQPISSREYVIPTAFSNE